MSPTFSLAILHKPGDAERDAALDEMRWALMTVDGPPVFRIIDDARPEGMSFHEFKTHIFMKQWEWSLKTDATHHVFMTDDLNIMPGFWLALTAMVEAKPESCIGILSNHPRAVELFEAGERWYRCNSWIVGPAYVVPRAHLGHFLKWYCALPDSEAPGGRRWYNDDSALNEWVTREGPHESWHPLPTIIEHRADVGSTVGHGDEHSRERVSWRETRTVQKDADGKIVWTSVAHGAGGGPYGCLEMSFWDRSGPMLPVGP